jgi:4-hydroxybenzoate polyprenyltransferase
MVYGTALILGVPLTSLWRAALVVLLSLVPGAAYVSVINDVTDREEDRAAGKPNRLEGRPPLAIAILIALTVAFGIGFAWMWRDDPRLVACYLAAWLAFSLYSLPPFRFKARGILGVLCDAGGAHLFPTLVAVLIVARDANRVVGTSWLAAVAVWSFAYGLRGILWHQLTDRDNDRSAGVGTFAQRHEPAVAERLGALLVFPLELAGLAALLWQLRSPWAVAFLAAYCVFAYRKAARFRPVIVAARPQFFIVLHEYYDVFLPLSLLLASALRHPIDSVVVAIHLVLFPVRAWKVTKESWYMRPFQKR